MKEIARRILVDGRVQGVGYRYWAVTSARHWGVRGWVRNRHDGTVELFCIGPVDAVEAFTERCSEGPAAALVTDLAVYEAIDDGSVGFETRATV